MTIPGGGGDRPKGDANGKKPDNRRGADANGRGADGKKIDYRKSAEGADGRALQVDPMLSCLDRAWLQRSKLKYHEALSNYNFNFNLRRHMTARSLITATAARAAAGRRGRGAPRSPLSAPRRRRCRSGRCGS